jgi:hypothetical protein
VEAAFSPIGLSVPIPVMSTVSIVPRA